MKGGKGGVGRKRNAPTKATEKAAPRDVVKKGATKKDWGAMSSDDFDGPPKAGAKPAPASKPGGRRR